MRQFIPPPDFLIPLNRILNDTVCVSMINASLWTGTEEGGETIDGNDK